MQKEVKEWLEQAGEDLETAMYNFRGEKYKYTAFLCHQCVEKSLKAVLIKKTGRLKRVHDLVFLGKEVKLPADLLDYCKEITPAYLYARYPDVVKIEDLKEKSKIFIHHSEEIFAWARNQLSRS